MNVSFIETILRDTDADRVRFQSYRAFLLLWLLFEAWLTELSGAETARGKIDWFRNNDNYFKDCWRDIITQGYVNAIAQKCPIPDKRFNPPRNPVTITDPNNLDLAELVEIIYRIRCNLIHGHEDVNDSDNLNLYSACGTILYKWLKWTSHIAWKRSLIR